MDWIGVKIWHGRDEKTKRKRYMQQNKHVQKPGIIGAGRLGRRDLKDGDDKARRRWLV